MRRVALAFSLAVTGWGCGSKEPTPVVLHAIGGLDSKAFDGDPKVIRVELRIRATDSTEKLIATTTLAAASIDVPEDVRTGTGSLVLRGIDDNGKSLAYGRTPLLDLSALAQPTDSIAILVPRFAVATRALHVGATVARPRLAMLGDRYLVVADASSTTAQIVDLLTYSTHMEDRAFDVRPSSLAIASSHTLVVDETGTAKLVDLSAGTSTDATLPSGFSFSDVALGSTITGESGSAYVVGCTRRSSASDLVVRLDPAGTLTARKLARPKSGCAATFLPGRGLVVLGGTSTATDAPGIELLAPGSASFGALPFPKDDVAGVVGAPISASAIVRIAPDGSVKTLELSCAASCAPVDSTLKAEIVTPREGDTAFALEGGSIAIVRGGRVQLLDAAGTSLRTLHDAGTALVAATLLSNGAAAIVTSQDDVLRVMLGDPP